VVAGFNLIRVTKEDGYRILRRTVHRGHY
jgi:Zn-dependent protease